MADDVVKSVGAGGGYDYTSLTAWEDATDNNSLITADERRIAELYGTVTESATVTIQMAASGYTDATRYRWVRAASGERFDVAAGTGAFLDCTSTTALYALYMTTNAEYSAFGNPGFKVESAYNSSGSNYVIYGTSDDQLFDGLFLVQEAGTAYTYGLLHTGSATNVTVRNCTARNDNSTTGIMVGLYCSGTGEVSNNSVYNTKQSDTADAVGIVLVSSGGTLYAYNNVAIDCGKGAIYGDFYISFATVDYCCSGDTSATGANSITEKTASECWEDADNDDFHIAASSPTDGAGTDRGSYDDQAGDSWDTEGWSMGCLATEAAGATTHQGASSEVSDVTATAAGGITTAGAGSEVADVTATAAGSIIQQGAASDVADVTATAAGEILIPATTSEVIDITATAAGTVQAVGTGAESVDVTSTAAGIVTAVGEASEAVDVVASAAGTLTIPGATSEIVNVTATAAGEVVTPAAASETIDVTATASGLLSSPGAASETIDVTATANGAQTHQGSISEVSDVTATATGTITTQGTASEVIGVTATAEGTVTAEDQGEASETIDVTADATATQTHQALASLLADVTAVATGGLTTDGAASEAIGITATAAGEIGIYGAASEIIDATADAAGQIIFAGAADESSELSLSGVGYLLLAGAAILGSAVSATATATQVQQAATAEAIGITATATATLIGVHQTAQNLATVRPEIRRAGIPWEDRVAEA